MAFAGKQVMGVLSAGLAEHLAMRDGNEAPAAGFAVAGGRQSGILGWPATRIIHLDGTQDSKINFSSAALCGYSIRGPTMP
jgi:hypothetical protein